MFELLIRNKSFILMIGSAQSNTHREIRNTQTLFSFELVPFVYHLLQSSIWLIFSTQWKESLLPEVTIEFLVVFYLTLKCIVRQAVSISSLMLFFGSTVGGQQNRTRSSIYLWCRSLCTIVLVTLVIRKFPAVAHHQKRTCCKWWKENLFIHSIKCRSIFSLIIYGSWEDRRGTLVVPLRVDAEVDRITRSTSAGLGPDPAASPFVNSKIALN